MRSSRALVLLLCLESVVSSLGREVVLGFFTVAGLPDPSQKSRQTLPLKRMLISQEKLTCPNALVQNLNNKLLAMP